jgi:hypothetical protein
MVAKETGFVQKCRENKPSARMAKEPLGQSVAAKTRCASASLHGLLQRA